MKKIGVAILGLAGVGGETYEILTRHGEFYRRTQHVEIAVESMLEGDEALAAALGVPAEKIAANIAEVVCNADVDIVVVTVGGTTSAREYVLDALNAGKTVVTSNGELFCKFYSELDRAAKRHNAGLYYGAGCAGGLPVVRTLLDGVQSNEITSVAGVLGVAANEMLARMENGCTYEEARAAAGALGYGEAELAAAAEGYDAAYQLSILASLAFHVKVPLAKVFREGIAGISAEDIAGGREFGYRVRFLSVARQTPSGIEARVHPALVKAGGALAETERGAAVRLTGDGMGELLLLGKDAGKRTAGSAVVSDILYAAAHSEGKVSTLKTGVNAEDIRFVSDFSGAYYFRITAAEPAGALAKLTALFAKYGIAVERIEQRGDGTGAEIFLITGGTHELAVKNAVTRLNASGVGKVECVLRIVE